MSCRLHLHVHKSKNPAMPSKPYIEIYSLGQKGEKSLVSSQYYSMQDLDAEIQAIKLDLEEIRKKAERELK
jgi:hypothetical protein